MTLKNEKDEDVDLSTLAVERGVVLFLVPKADTRKSLCLTVAAHNKGLIFPLRWKRDARIRPVVSGISTPM
jgi:hypothetical protein